MPKIILHHYPESPFAEKIRLLLGYKHANYQAVTIPVIMPKPDLMPLTGGYRRTPVMQLGADIYCDTALIARVIDELLPDGTIYPPGNEATVAATARWTDSVFFRTCISVAFQPRALAESPLFQDQAAAEAFLRDRAELAGGASLTLPPETALPLFHNHLGNLDRQLAGSAFLFGNQPTEADFSSYHCCWFVHRNAALAGEFDHAAQVLLGPRTQRVVGGEGGPLARARQRHALQRLLCRRFRRGRLLWCLRRWRRYWRCWCWCCWCWCCC